MRVYAISDLHLSINNPKPMNIFGPVWDNYLSEIEDSMKDMTDDDILLIPGDISWAMKLDDAVIDLEYISKHFKGKKYLLRGNHDYWWGGISSLRSVLPKDMYAIQNDAIKDGNIIICGTRGWVVPEYKHKSPQDEKIYNRELIRLELSLREAASLKGENDKIICMLHYPPFNSKCEDSDFTMQLEKYGVDCVVYGHLHSTDKKHTKYLVKNGIEYYLSSCDLVGNRVVKIMDTGE